MWAGAVLLTFDFQRGLLRPLAVLPVTGGQLGRSWWLATVLFPAIGLAVLLFCGAATCCYVRPNHIFPTERLVLGSLFTFGWLGLEFTMTFNATRSFSDTAWAPVCNPAFTLLTVVVFFGSMIFCQDAAKSPFRSAVLLGLGAWFTAAGWLLARRFEPGRAAPYLRRLIAANQPRGEFRLFPLRAKVSSECYAAPEGKGGMALLMKTLFVRGFCYLAAMVGLMALLWVLQAQFVERPPDRCMFVTMGSFMSCWFLLFFQFMPILAHLRLLRTLPMSPAALAATLLALVVLPLLALGGLVSAIMALVQGATAGLACLNSYLFVSAAGSVCVFFAVWRGAGMQGYSLLLLSLFSFLIGYLWLGGHFHLQELPLSLSALIATSGVLVAFVFTRLALVHSSHAYRVQGDPFGRIFPGQR
jgi:hypothetical protein